MKKLLSLVLVVMMALALVPATAEEAAGLPAMTTENITLTVAHWGQAEAGEPEVIEALIAQFEAAYPNINVEFVAIDQGSWDQALTNLAAVLEEAGSDLSKVLKTTVFLRDMDDFAAMNGVYAEFFAGSAYPARSAVQVAKLPKGARIEIEAVAHK